MDVAIAGSTGLIGSALTERLRAEGHRVVRMVRPSTDGGGGDAVMWDPMAGRVDGAGLEGLAAVLNFSGHPVRKRFTAKQKELLRASRVTGTRLLAETLAGLQRPPAVFVNASGINFYGASRGDEVLTEESAPGGGFMADLAVDWEAATAPAADAGIRTVMVRTGLTLQRGEQVLGRMLPIFKLGLGGRLASGRQWWSWIAMEDEIGGIVHVLGSDVSGPVNFTAPQPVRNAEFTRTLAGILRRPAVLPVPTFALRLGLGREMADELALVDLRVVPTKLEASGYRFVHPELEGALRAVL